MAFQLGSIVAKIALDTTEFNKGLRRIRSALDRLKVSVGKKSEQISTAIVAPIQKGMKGLEKTIVAPIATATKAAGSTLQKGFTQPIAAGLSNVAKKAKSAGSDINTALGMERQWVKPIPLIERLGSSLKGVGTVASKIGAAASVGFGLLHRAIRLLITPITKLRILFFNLRFIIASLAVFQLIRLANQLEIVSGGFRNLTNAIGITASTFLPKLRKAMKGTVSDLELMRAANQAMLLGIIQSEDQFAELAQAARRLGRAIGRDPLMALNDLTLGIGRQSWRILDNIGIIVKVEQAYKDYARQLNVTVRDLSDFEKRQAFLVATTEAVRRKLQELGPDVLTATDKFNQLGATLANVFAKIGRLIVGGGGVFAAINSFIKRNERAILAYANAIRRAFAGIFNEVAKFVSRLSSGELKIGDVISDIITQTLVLVREGIVLITEFLVRALVGVIVKLPITLLPAIGTMMFELQIQIFKALTDLVINLVKGLLKLLVKVVKFFDLFGVAETVLEKLGLDKETLDNAIDGVGEFVRDVKDFVPDALSDAFQGARAFGIKNTIDEVRTSLEDTAESASKKFVPAMKKASTVLGAFGAIFDKVKRAFDFEIKDPAFGLETQKINRVLQPYQKLLDVIKLVRYELFRRGVDQTYLDTLTEEQALNQIKAYETSLKTSGEAIIFLQDILTKGSNLIAKGLGFLPTKIDISVVEEFTKNFKDAVAQFEDELTISPELDTDPIVSKMRELTRELNSILSRSFTRGGGVFLTEEIISNITEQIGGLSTFLRRGILEFERTIQDVNQEIDQLILGDFGAEIKNLETRSRAFVVAFNDLKNLMAEAVNFHGPLTEGWQKQTDALKRLEPILGAYNDKLQETKRRVVDLKSLGGLEEIFEQFEELRKTVENFGLSPTQIAIKDAFKILPKLEEKYKSALNFMGPPTEEMLGDLQLGTVIEKLKKSIEEADLNESILNFKRFTSDVSNSLFTGVAQAFARGEDLGKVWSSFLAETFERAMRDTIERLSTFISNTLAGALEDLGIGSGAAGLVTGLLGIAAGILSRLESQRSSTVDDFESAINSSEAVRGVVAGPTNVAISEVGDQLKTALRQTEVFLARIANAVEGRPFSASTGGIGDPGIVIRTSGATAT